MKSSATKISAATDSGFGEPWELDFGKELEMIRFGIFSTTKLNLAGRRLGIANLCETQGEHEAESRTGKRIVECVNALAKIKDPEKVLARAREALVCAATYAWANAENSTGATKQRHLDKQTELLLAAEALAGLEPK